MFFEDWNNIYSSNYEQITNDTIKVIYDVFDAFYSPRDLKRIGDSEWGDSIYTKSKYLLVQNSIDYSVMKTDAYYDSTLKDQYIFLNQNDSILFSELKKTNFTTYHELLENVKNEDARYSFKIFDDFRPKTIYNQYEILYIDKRHYKKIKRYLGKQNIDFGILNLMNPASPRKSNRNRQTFLNQYIVVWHGHWGGYWHISSHPLVSDIVFENDLKTAYVSFRVVYQFGRATLKLIDNNWILIESEISGIE